MFHGIGHPLQKTSGVGAVDNAMVRTIAKAAESPAVPAGPLT